ncbi:DUF6542 domain-containing protein [Mycobacterium sp. URHB0044]|uniref:DUF6542 domain-containing protein n=1 Tax=Mycobacterium sp. URHB0044 TaxID=1380386 RepID=UPI000490F152|nr:DUF6542 domain-containing protein [Mycobacterium sp. URHB0044]
MSGQRARSAVAADHQSVLPRVPGVPWWGAVVLAATAAAVGFAYDAGTGDKTLSSVFTVCYVAGCLLAVLGVRQSGVFTAVIQPPLILFFLVPTAYFVFHGGTFTGIKDTLINSGYPLIERFPLMFFTSAAVLLIGMVRWYLGMAAGRRTAHDDDTATPDAAASDSSAAAAALATEGKTSARRARRHTIERPSRAAAAAAAAAEEDAPQRPARKPRAATGSTRASRSRHTRPPETEIIEPVARPRRPRPAAAPTDPPAEPRRRSRSSEPREPREPRERREPRAARERRNLPPIEPRDVYDRSDRYDRPQRQERPERRRRAPEDYDSYEPRPRSGLGGSTGSDAYHPVSRVRYRGTDDGESRTENRKKPRHSLNSDADSWRYDL